jgi:hypothetical protein
MSWTVINIGSDGSDDEFNFQLKELETTGARKRRRAHLEASGGTTPQRNPILEPYGMRHGLAFRCVPASRDLINTRNHQY